MCDLTPRFSSSRGVDLLGTMGGGHGFDMPVGHGLTWEDPELYHNIVGTVLLRSARDV